MKIRGRKIKIPIFFVVGVVLVLLALIFGGTSLATQTGIRYLGGLVGGIVAAGIGKKVYNKRKIKRKN